MSSRICGRSCTSIGTASAAASEIAPRIPAQPTAIRSRTVTPKPPAGIAAHAIRTAMTVSATASAWSASSPTSSSSARRGACSPSRTNRSASSPNTMTRQNAMPDSRVPASIAECAFQPE